MRETNTSMAGTQISLGLIITVMQDVLKRWYLIAAATLIAAMAVFVVTDFNYKPEYRATTTFVATSSSTSTTTYSNLTAASTAASLFSEMLNSSVLKQKVLEQIGVSYFDGTVSAEVVPDTNLLTMTVKGHDPRLVFQMSKAIIAHHHIVSDQVLDNTILEVLQDPVVPVRPTNSPDTKTNAALLAAVGVAPLLAIISYMSDKVRSREEADAKLSCRILGELYHERKNKTRKNLFSRKKKSILITDPLTSFSYAESVHKLSGRVDKRRHKGEHIIMVTSLLENEGKSTVAVNLALSLAKKGKRVLLIDGDLRKPACHLILNQSNSVAGVAEILHKKTTLMECVQQLENSSLDLLSSKRVLRATTNLISSPAMEQMLKDAADDYDIVIVDTPPMSITSDAVCISEFADAALLVVRQNAAKAEDINEAASILEKTNTHLLGCVLNNVYGSGNFSPVFQYGSYGKYGKYGKYSKYGYGKYGYARRRESSNEEMKL